MTFALGRVSRNHERHRPGESERIDMSLKQQLIKWGGAGIAFGATVLTAAGCAHLPCIHGKYACGGACAPAIEGPKKPATEDTDSAEPAPRFIASQDSAAPTRVINVYGAFNGPRHPGQPVP